MIERRSVFGIVIGSFQKINYAFFTIFFTKKYALQEQIRLLQGFQMSKKIFRHCLFFIYFLLFLLLLPDMDSQSGQTFLHPPFEQIQGSMASFQVPECSFRLLLHQYDSHQTT